MADPLSGWPGWRGRLRSVRVRTTLVAVAVVGAALAVAGVALVELLDRSLTDQVETAAQLRADDVAGALESGTDPGEVTGGEDSDLVIQVLGRNGTVVAHSKSLRAGEVLPTPPEGASSSARVVVDGEREPYLVTAARVETEDGGLTVLVGRSADLVTESRQLVTAVLLGGIPILMLVVGVTTWFVVGRALAPVEGMRREVDEISARELHRRVPDPGSGDEIARLAATMNRMLDRLQDSQARQNRFISDASHELRSPVATIRHHAEVAIAHPDEQDDVDLSEVVLSEVLRIQHLVEDLLFLARSDERTLPVNRRTLDLDDLVLDEAARLRATTALSIDVSGVSAGQVEGDPTQLRRVVRNLADNATRHARSRVAMTLRGAAVGVVLTVEDDGAGVPAEDRQRIFERFVRLDEARARSDGGTGLGLAITAEIVAAHDGTVEVDASSLGGARFEVVLPTARGWST